MKRLLVACICVIGFVSCSDDANVVIPYSSTDVLLQETKRIAPQTRSLMEGIYNVSDGSDVFGDQVVLKWSYVVSANLMDTLHTLSIFSGRDMCYFAMSGGSLDSVFLFSGYWRRMVSAETGIAKFTILSSQGGKLLFSPAPVVGAGSIVLTGAFGAGQGLPDRKVTLTYSRPLYNKKRFDVLAHRGGGRTSDMLPASENSVEMMLFTPVLGSNAVEIDVRTSKDGVLFMYHDGELNSRLTQATGLVGTVENYTYAQLYTYVRLIHGERIPRLEDVLNAALYRTPIRVVYLDSKASANMELMRSVQKDFIAKAAAAGRDFQVLIGLPSDEKVSEFKALPDYASAPSLNELTLEGARDTKSLVWVPRWTMGPNTENVAQMHAEGKKVYTWTMDVPAYVEQYMAQSDFDGMVTNYPPMVAYYHYIRQ
jgi:glycerophosphoryl diester phosphodiesterase